MVADKIGKKLHDKFTRGQKLTPEEHTQLEAWYSQLDAQEGKNLSGRTSDNTLELEFKKALESTYQKIAQLTKQLKETEQENDQLRAENRKTRQQLEKVLVQQQA